MVHSPRDRAGTKKSASKQSEDVMLEIGHVNPRQYFGELALLHKRAHTASVVSVTPVHVLILSKYDFYHLVDARTQELMHSYAKKFYLDDNAVRNSIQKQYEWNQLKHDLNSSMTSSTW